LNLKKFKFSQNLKKSKIKPKFDNEELQESKVPTSEHFSPRRKIKITMIVGVGGN